MRIGGKAHLKKWWEPLLKMTFGDPEQEPPYWTATNNLVLRTPFPGILIKAASLRDKDFIEVFLSGTGSENLEAIRPLVRRDRRYLLDNLPSGTVLNDPQLGWPIGIKNDAPLSDAEKHAWLASKLKAFVNVLRPRLRKWYEETRA